MFLWFLFRYFYLYIFIKDSHFDIDTQNMIDTLFLYNKMLGTLEVSFDYIFLHNIWFTSQSNSEK